MFFVRQLNLFPHLASDGIGYAVIPDREEPSILHCARIVRHRELAFPRFADPAFARKFLHESGAITAGVGVMQGNP